MTRKTGRRLVRGWIVLAATAVVVVAASAPASLRLEPSDTQVTFELDTTFHAVHGTMEVTEGEIGFDPSSGELSGRVVVDATSADTGERGRDQRMHNKVLESAEFPRIIFTPRRFSGQLREEGDSDLQLAGSIEIHGASHEVEIPAHVRIAGDTLSGTAVFMVPYVEWGMKDPSVLMFRCKKEVRIDLKFGGHLAATNLASWNAAGPR